MKLYGRGRPNHYRSEQHALHPNAQRGVISMKGIYLLTFWTEDGQKCL